MEQFASIEYLISLTCAGARGHCPQAPAPDWPEILSLAAEQNVLPLSACALLHAPENFCPPEIRSGLLDAMRAASSVNMVRRQRILDLIRKMEAAGITVTLLKGYAVADCYAYPDCRETADTDLLIDPSHEKKACALFEQLGFRVHPRQATSHHVVCQHARYGMIELHVQPYAELVGDVWFRGMGEEELFREATVSCSCPDGTYSTLGYTDHLIFLALHMVKHFLFGGLTLRMMLDLALFFSRHRSDIDSMRLWNVLDKLGYTPFICAVLQIMTRYAAFSPEEFPGLRPVSDEKTQLLLEDLLRGGYMGAKQEQLRYESGMAYNRQLLRKSKSEGQYRCYMLLWKIKGAMKFMFPSLGQLRRQYPRAAKSLLAVPFVWLYNIFAFPIRKIRGGALRRDIPSDTDSQSEFIQNRLDLFRSLEML